MEIISSELRATVNESSKYVQWVCTCFGLRNGKWKKIQTRAFGSKKLAEKAAQDWIDNKTYFKPKY